VGAKKLENRPCWAQCNCDNPIAGNTHYKCNYGTCRGFKCQSCGEWWVSQYGEACSIYTIPTADTLEGQLEIALLEIAELKSRMALRNRQIRDLRRQLRK